MKADKVRLVRQIELHKRVLAEKDQWYSHLEKLQAQVPVYNEKQSVSSELLQIVSRKATDHGLELGKVAPSHEKLVGSLYELSINISWEGSLDALVHFLYAIQKQGIAFDVRQFNAKPDAQRNGVLVGSMNIDCAYKKRAANATPDAAPPVVESSESAEAAEPQTESQPEFTEPAEQPEN
ncbi:MAG: hypothetical protein FJ220_05340 [Kiritimatiellaceae bacterium]|nr:hypothetical protein [Kiritimatiellaceae bacterium]